MDDCDPMEIDETVPNSTIIENDTKLTNQNDQTVLVLDDDDIIDTPTTTQTTNQTHDMDVEVIDLVTRTNHSKCINYACTSGEDLLPAPIACLSYYRIRSTAGQQQLTNKEICKNCYEHAMNDYDRLVTAMKSGRLLFEVDNALRNELVEIDDSDDDQDNQQIIDTKKEQSNKTHTISSNNMDFLTKNLEKILENTMKKMHFNERIDNELDYLRNKSKQVKRSLNELDELMHLEREHLDIIQKSLYEQFRPRTLINKQLNIIDDCTIGGGSLAIYMGDTIDDDATAAPSSSVVGTRRITRTSMRRHSMADMMDCDSLPPKDLPLVGLLEKPIPKIGNIYYIIRDNMIGSWIRARLISTLTNISIDKNLIKFHLIELKKQNERNVDGKHLAYLNPATILLGEGTRVIALLKDVQNSIEPSTSTPSKSHHGQFYPGIVAEIPTARNRYRYLIFYDIGYYQYVNHTMVHLIYESSTPVWLDMPKNSRDFIKKYLEQPHKRQTVKLDIGTNVRIEYNNRWEWCTVEQIDCSLVCLCYDSMKRIEWIYRGSSRLMPVYLEEMRQQQQEESKNLEKSTIILKRNDSHVPRAVARKSTTRSIQSAVPFLPPPPSEELPSMITGPTSKIMYFTPRDQMITQRLYKPHLCSKSCNDYIKHGIMKLRAHNPLSKPILCGWARMSIKIKYRREIIYKAPCGRMLRNIGEIHEYLRMTKSDMTIDLFDFNQNIRCLAEFSVECTAEPKDLSNGLEQVPIPVVNGIDNEKIDFHNYSIKREPMQDVHLNLDPEFLCGCDCEDDCVDKTKCACWRLTLEGAKYMGRNVDINTFGYVYRRLPEPVMTGIYECNSRCRCSKLTCLNRVVQHPLSLKLQVFRTHNRGWGIRCLNDIPQGTFICIYAGTIHTEQMANEDGLQHGDEYFAELDYIEICEQHKQDYEAEVIEPERNDMIKRRKNHKNDHIEQKMTSSEDEDDDDEDEDEDMDEHLMSGGRRRKRIDDNDFVYNLNVYGNTTNIRERLRKRNVDDNNAGAGSSTTTTTTQSVAPSNDEKIKKEKFDKIIEDMDTVTISDDEDDPKEVLNFNPNSEMDKNSLVSPSVRTLFGKDEAVYVMDAKNAGNIGRFLNHSCSPNVFVQNVFVDTHDVRFPCVAFFCSQFLRAGMELTWNYNYDIGSVPGKVLYCYCGSAECKGRLL